VSFVPEVISPEYSEIKTRADHSHVRRYKFPQDRIKIAGLSLAEKQIWYAAQDPQPY